MDKATKTDSFVVLWKVGKQGTKQMLGKTEMIPDNLNPEFVKTIEVDFFFEEQHLFLLEVYDCDDATTMNDLKNQ